MKILIVGGGPGGLYAGLLLKKAHPHYDIEIVERNPAGATYGWGVVFSDRTLNAFREADYKTYQEITDNFVIWHAIDTHYRGQLLRCDGHSFAGLSRRLMLNILQQRCAELGITMTFERELTDFSCFSGHDLVIAADGVNSLIRGAFADTFNPRLTTGKAKFIWFGTDKVLDSFTFIFRENEHGLFQAHAYPFEGHTSTFIVECEEAVWQRAGLDAADEAGSIAYCERLFADFLSGHRLLSNKSLWLNFVTVKNRTWRHENVVLLGDAAHTAHFSIGSGTKLAMEDAIALANAFETTTDLDIALNQYTMERRPYEEILQRAARESQTYFENIRRYLHLEPPQFTSHLLTRSGRVTYDNLRVRDPYFIDRVDRWFTAAAAPVRQTTPVLIAPPPAFTPLKLRGLSLTNRVAIAPAPTFGAADGLLANDDAGRFTRLAHGGAALVFTAPVAVSADGRITPGDAGLYDEAHLSAWQAAVETCRAQSNARVGLRLNHAGRRGAARPRDAGLDRPLAAGGWPLLAASPIPYATGSPAPREMARPDMERIQAAFVHAAEMARDAGFDLLQLHVAHGYLLASFLSPLSNHRSDEFGGPLENRARYPLQVFEAVRAVWPEEKPVAVALTATDWEPGGLTVEESVVIATLLKDAGCDLIEVLAGQTTPNARPVYGADFLSAYSDRLRHEAGVATMVGGYLTTSGEMNAILAAGQADLCLMTPRGR